MKIGILLKDSETDASRLAGRNHRLAAFAKTKHEDLKETFEEEYDHYKGIASKNHILSPGGTMADEDRDAMHSDADEDRCTKIQNDLHATALSTARLVEDPTCVNCCLTSSHGTEKLRTQPNQRDVIRNSLKFNELLKFNILRSLQLSVVDVTPLHS
ncbi:hypothetical protein GCK32_006338 [Trichostrongylus colubriformis]|uniref:Uncharacterized protein n=1 Tax=Trichostrongylus colubriformis TaxID=6319 RepID=A0AAN8IFF3_TRICO